MGRDWASARRIKDESLGRWVRANGTTAAFRLAQSLLDQVWDQVKKDKRRGRDVSDLIRLTGKLARASTIRR